VEFNKTRRRVFETMQPSIAKGSQQANDESKGPELECADASMGEAYQTNSV
jgi:hypothetical protein